MILHAASIAAFFLQQTPQTQCVVQCEAQSSIWMQLLVSALPSLLALGVAWFAFWLNSRWNRKQWVLDQKKAEWRGLLDKLNSVYFPMALAKQMKKPLPLNGSQRLIELSQCFQDRVFIDAAILSKFHDRSVEYVQKYIGESEDKPSSDEDKSEVLDKLMLLTKEVREAAKTDLNAQG
jgi:hypothetical protein